MPPNRPSGRRRFCAVRVFCRRQNLGAGGINFRRAFQTKGWKPPLAAGTQKERTSNRKSFLFGAGNQTRTDDLLITNQLLYRLSYSSIHFHLSRSHRRQGSLDSASTIPHLPPAVKSVSQPRAFFVGQQGGKSNSRALRRKPHHRRGLGFKVLQLRCRRFAAFICQHKPAPHSSTARCRTEQRAAP